MFGGDFVDLFSSLVFLDYISPFMKGGALVETEQMSHKKKGEA